MTAPLENILGELTKDTPREELLLSTKFTPQIEDGTVQAMQNMLDGSKERLHTDVIDIYWIHNPMDVEKYTQSSGQTRFLERQVLKFLQSRIPGRQRPGKVYNPMMPQIEKLTKILAEIGQAHGISAAQTATAWQLQKAPCPSSVSQRYTM